MHLLLPLLASLLFVCGLLFVKRVSQSSVRPEGVDQITLLFFVNLGTSGLMGLLYLFDGVLFESSAPTSSINWSLIWQPLIVAVLFMLGLIFTFTAVEVGDVSIATPVFGVKVVFVTCILALSSSDGIPPAIWGAALLASMGIALIQWTGQHHPKRIGVTIALALTAATCYATFDTLVQRWSPAWGSTRFLPAVFAMVAALTLLALPWVRWRRIPTRGNWKLMLPAVVLLALQAFCITLAVSVFGDAARLNVVYSLRGLWGVLLAYTAARIWGGSEADLTSKLLVMRLSGAGLLTLAVALAVLS
ncbi:DMT family transporter [Rhodopirellula halodulae]|uniref:DMT family transporter n=1 Tax=Rhodopirellula halodulae TaxID=2894198 RepID=UPI001E3312C9|nr:DMT family transporter [Rhodopirellula sp. JC737]MCC9655714.1 DMT family transporter [Rhodopirellula sp. JC737]